MSDDLDDMIKRTRRVISAQAQPDDERPLPPGFADRIARAREESPSAPVALILWQRLSFAGVAVACALTITSTLIFRSEAEMLAADPWLDMPMSSLINDEFEEGELTD